METTIKTLNPESVRPPVASVGILGWMRKNLFNSVFNSILTILTVYLLWRIVPPFIQWAFVDSSWYTTSEQCRAGDGACWSIITRNIRFILFGFFPYDQHWRPLVAMLILFTLLGFSRNRKHWKKHLGYAWIAGLLAMGLLMKGGVFGLHPLKAPSGEGFLSRCFWLFSA
jgi:general L-amino acid transport system permease protein